MYERGYRIYFNRVRYLFKVEEEGCNGTTMCQSVLARIQETMWKDDPPQVDGWTVNSIQMFNSS